MGLDIFLNSWLQLRFYAIPSSRTAVAQIPIRVFARMTENLKTGLFHFLRVLNYYYTRRGYGTGNFVNLYLSIVV